MNEQPSKEEKALPTGFDCSQCNKRHEFGPYVAAHWDMMLIHTCDGCGALHHVRQGIATHALEVVESKFDVGVYP